MTVQDVLDTVRDSDRLEALRMTGLLDTGADEAFDRLTRIAVQMTGAPVSFVSLVDDEHQFIKSCTGAYEPFEQQREVGLEYSFCKHTVAESAPVIIADTSEDERVVDNPAREAFDIAAYVGVPLTTSDGYTLGSFCVIDDEPHDWSDEDVQALRDLAAFTVTEIELRADLIERKALESELKHRANHDALTELANRDLLWRRLEGAIERGCHSQTTFALFYLDLDHFKAINDQFGHVVGDQLLQVVARRMEAEVRESDALARLGGDEFVGLLEDVGGRDHVASIVTRLLETLSEPIGVESHTLEIGVSLGVVLCSFEDEHECEEEALPEPQTLIRQADTTMYRAKDRDLEVAYSTFDGASD
jgi:diguanylate cyclase (GGDEF)-like protein